MRRLVLCLVVVAVLARGAYGDDKNALPLGHPDYYPSAERPIGWRGDGTGAWPAAKVVTTWNAETGENIVWKSPMPAPSFAQPIVVGDKVFTLADPHILVCVNVHNGKILWQTELDHALAMPPDKAKRARAERKFIANLRREYGEWLINYRAFEAKIKKKGKTMASFSKLAAATPAKKGGGDDILDDLGDLDEDGDDGMAGPSMDIGGVSSEELAEFRKIEKGNKEKGFAASGKYAVIGIKAGRGETTTPTMRRLQKAWREFDLLVTDQWGEPWTTETLATPCSDGKYVYVATCNNAIARVDMKGKIDWIVWAHIDNRPGEAWGTAGVGTRFCSSPLLMDNKLIVNHNGELRVYDAETGKKLWSKYNPYDKMGQGPWRPHPESLTPACIWLPLPHSTASTGSGQAGSGQAQGGRLAAFTDAGRNLYRLDDGKILTAEMATMTWVSPVFSDGLYCYRSAGPLVKGKRGVQRLKAVSRDKVEVEPLWSIPNGGGAPGARCATDIFHDGKIILNNKIVNPLNGEVDAVAKPGPEKIDTQNRSPIVAGDHAYALGWEQAWVFGLKSGKYVHVEKAFNDNGVKEDKEWKFRWGWTRNMNHSSPCAQANRLFVRSKGYLWCIGDPEQPFPVPGKW